MTQTDLPPTIRLFTEIGIIDQLVRNQFERSLPDGLKTSQFTVLNHLVRLGGDWNPARLAAAFQVTKAAMTNTIQRLEKRKLVVVAPDPKDGRGKLVRITTAGEKMRERCLESMAPIMLGLQSEISDKDIAVALPVLEKIRSYLDAQRASGSDANTD